LSHFLKDEHFQISTQFSYLIKGTVLARMLWGANTFVTTGVTTGTANKKIIFNF